MTKRTRQDRLLWVFFSIGAIVLVAEILSSSYNLDFSRLGPVALLAMSFPVLAVIVFGGWSIGWRRTLLFLGLAAVLGWALEVVGLETGIVFGSDYEYDMGRWAVLDVPLLIPVFWFVFIFNGYIFTNSLLLWSGRTRPALERCDLLTLPWLVLLDSLVAVSFDLFLDPLLVRAGNWSWAESGPYFGIPAGNFLGWFVVAALVSAVYRLFEYFKPAAADGSISPENYILPLLGYVLLGFKFIDYALLLILPELALVGFLAMLPFWLLGIFYYSRFKAFIREKETATC